MALCKAVVAINVVLILSVQQWLCTEATSERSSRRVVSDINKDTFRNDRTTTAAGMTTAAVPSMLSSRAASQSSMILQRRYHSPQQQRHQIFPTKSTTKVRAATKLIAEKRWQVSSYSAWCMQTEGQSWRWTAEILYGRGACNITYKLFLNVRTFI